MHGGSTQIEPKLGLPPPLVDDASGSLEVLFADIGWVCKIVPVLGVAGNLDISKCL